MSETKLTGAACRWCGSDDDECLYTQCHDLPDGEEHAPCGAYFPSEDNVSDAGIGRAALTLAQARIRELEEALGSLLHAVCGETGFANAVRKTSGTAYPWPALDLAEQAARQALKEATDV